MTADDPALSALTHLRDGGLVSDRDALNRAWQELTGRLPTSTSATCQARGCHEPGRPFVEPAGTWCMAHLPTLWRQPANRWATPRCHRCGQPGGWPNGLAIARPVCRTHAPRWLRKYLTPTVEELTA